MAGILMMRWIGPVGLMALSSVAAVSQVTSSPTQDIVTVSFNAAVLQTAEAKRELEALQTKFAPQQKQLQVLDDEVESLRKQIEGGKLSDTDSASREQALDSKEKQLQRQSEDLKNDSQTESQQVFQRVGQKVYAFLQSYSKQHAYSLVVERGSDAAPVVWFAADKLDITAQLVKAYDALGTTGAAPAVSNPGSTAKPAQALPESPSPRP